MKRSAFKTDGDKRRDFIFVSLVIHIMATLHSISCFLLRVFDKDDGLVLTILTITMVVLLISYFKGTTDVFLSLLLISCLAGFYLGTNGAYLISLIIPDYPVLTHVIATFIVTEILGWLVFIIVRRPLKR